MTIIFDATKFKKILLKGGNYESHTEKKIHTDLYSCDVALVVFYDNHAGRRNQDRHHLYKFHAC